MSELFEMDQELVVERFVIDTDSKAEWAMRKISERNKEMERFVDTCHEMINLYQEKINAEKDKAERDNANLMFLLEQYFNGVEHKVTKTQATYRLPSGRLKMKLPQPKMVVEDEELLMHQFPGYVDNVPKLRWGDLKKNLVVSDGKVLDAETGELVEGCNVEMTEQKLLIEVD